MTRRDGTTPTPLPPFTWPPEIAYIETPDGCYRCVDRATKDGYPILRVDGAYWYAHRYLYWLYYEIDPTDLIIRHRCDHRWCVNPRHLRSGDHVDNVRDRVRRDRSATGEANGRAKLNEAAVIHIYQSTATHASLARQFDVCPKTIRNIRNGERWQYLQLKALGTGQMHLFARQQEA